MVPNSSSVLDLLIKEEPDGRLALGREGARIVERFRCANKLESRQIAMAHMIGRFDHYERLRRLERLIKISEKHDGRVFFKKKGGKVISLDALLQSLVA